MNKIMIVFLISILFVPIIYSQDEWKITGQIQLRSELDGRDFSNDSHALTFASLRTRLGVEKSFMNKLNFFVQIQDSRVFGEEQSPNVSLKNVDLHQAYVILKNPFGWELDIQAGRFEVAYGTERFLGASNWSYIGRAWDGVRLKLKTAFKLDMFALTHSESVHYIGSAAPGNYDLTTIPTPTPSHSIYGFWESLTLNDQNQLDVFGYYQVNRVKILSEKPLLSRYTLGVNHFGKYEKFNTIFEGAFQFGDAAGKDISAYLISGQANYTTGDNKFGLGADILSGTKPGENKINNFDVSFGTNHKFYGFMDYFPGSLNNFGLNDIYISYYFQPSECEWEGGINFHHFISNKSQTYGVLIANQGYSFVDNFESYSLFGQEADITLKYNFVKGTVLSWGGSLFIPGDLMKFLFSTMEASRDDIGFWSYIMITANL